MTSKRGSAKGASLAVATGVLTFGLQQISTGNIYTGGSATLIGIVIFVGYQVAEDNDHSKTYDDVVNAIGEENFKELADMSADEIREIKENINQR